MMKMTRVLKTAMFQVIAMMVECMDIFFNQYLVN